MPRVNVMLLLHFFYICCICYIFELNDAQGVQVVRSGKPLLLTPFLKHSRIQNARDAAEVPSFVGNITSYAGYLTVNEKLNSNLYFWFFPAQLNYHKAPVILWLQGGPGSSSMFGLFDEHGPYKISKNMRVGLREYPWSKTMSVIYMDNPVGTGFSFTGADEGYATTEEDVAQDLYVAMQQFFKIFPELKPLEFYVTGESYAGKYIPAICYKIHESNRNSLTKTVEKINLKGMAIGNGLCDPIHMLGYGEYLHQIGLIDRNLKKVFDDKTDKMKMAIKGGDYEKAFDIFDVLLNGDLTEGKSLFYNATGFSSYYNFLRENDASLDNINAFIQQDFVRSRIHVGPNPFHTDKKVEMYLKKDVMKSVAPWVEVLMDNYKVILYSGQLDIIVAYPLTLEFIESLAWSGSEAYKVAPRVIWRVDGAIAGFAKTVGNFTEVLVRNAGHMVPSDQPKHAFDLINRFIFNKPF